MLSCYRVDVGSMDHHFAAYFECFHPSFPLLHRPTFSDRSPKVLRNIVVAIGSLYTAQNLSEEDSVSCLRGSHDLWDAGRQELTHMVSRSPLVPDPLPVTCFNLVSR